MEYRQIIARQRNCESRWLKINNSLNNHSGIYILTRIDENGFKFAYVGQAKQVLTRLGQHLLGYQHIDLSLKKHGLFDPEKNPFGYKVVEVETTELDEMERHYIKVYADLGYQLRNKTLGGQDKGKSGINDNKAPKGYHDGLKQGELNAWKEISVFFDKYLDYVIKGDTNKIKERKFLEFKEKLIRK